MEPGTWTEFLVGLGTIGVTGFLGYMAVKEARLATHFAQRAAHLQDEANQIAEASIHVGFSAELSAEMYHDGDEPGQRFDAWLSISPEAGSASAMVHRVETAGAFLGSFNATTIPMREMFGTWEVEPTPDFELPRRLHPGEELVFSNPWKSFQPRLRRGAGPMSRCFIRSPMLLPFARSR